MKKMMTLLAIGAASLTFAAVESQIVGYNTIDITQEYSLIAVNFEGLTNSTMTLNEIFPYDATNMTKGTSATGDLIQILNDGAYVMYFMAAGSGKTASLDGQWVKSSDGTVTTDSIATGTAAWYVSRKAAAAGTAVKLTVAGSVANDATKNMTIKQGYNLIANPYPTALPLNGSNGIGLRDDMTKGASSSVADLIQIFDATGVYVTYFMAAGFGKTAGLDGQWVKSSDGTVTTDSLPVGASAWYFSRGDQTFTIPVANPVQ